MLAPGISSLSPLILLIADESCDSTQESAKVDKEPEAEVVYVFEEYELEGTTACRNCRRFVGKHRPTTRQFNSYARDARSDAQPQSNNGDHPQLN